MARKKKSKITEENLGYKKLLGKNWKDLGEYRIDKAKLKISKLKASAIESHRLMAVKICEDTIILQESWIELILLMVYTIIDDNKDTNKFREILIRNKITNKDVSIEKTYGIVSFTGVHKVYKIPNTEYFLEARLDSIKTLELIAKLVHAIGIQDIEFIVERQTEHKTIYENRPEIELLILLNKIYEQYGEKALYSIKSVGRTWIGLEYEARMLDEYSGIVYEEISKSGLYILTDLEEQDIKEMIANLKGEYRCIK